MTEHEIRLAHALILMCNQYLFEEDDAYDTACMCAGQRAGDILVGMGLAEWKDGVRFFRLTKQGEDFENASIMIPWMHKK